MFLFFLLLGASFIFSAYMKVCVTQGTPCVAGITQLCSVSAEVVRACVRVFYIQAVASEVPEQQVMLNCFRFVALRLARNRRYFGTAQLLNFFKSKKKCSPSCSSAKSAGQVALSRDSRAINRIYWLECPLLVKSL